MEIGTSKPQDLPGSVLLLGCGYLGGRLAAALLAHGVRVGALTRNAERAAALRAGGVGEVIEAELDARDWHTRLEGDYAAVVNCVSSAGGGLDGYRKSYLEGQRSALEWARGRGLRRFVYTSSTSVYPQDGGVWVDESAPTEGVAPTGAILLESEALIAEASEAFEAWFVFRPAGIYGPGRHYLLDQLASGDGVVAGRGDYHMNMVHVDDIVAAILLALGPAGVGRSGVYNLTDGNPAPKETVLRWLAGRLGRPMPRFDPERVSPRLRRRGGRMPDRKIASDKARRLLGWSPDYGSFKEGYGALTSG